MSAPVRNVRAMRIGGTVLLVLFGIWAGFRVYSNRAPRPLQAQRHHAAGMRVPVGEASPLTESDFTGGFDPAQPPPAAKIPERLPDFSLRDPTGKETPISAWAGKALILNFWATWCAPCRREIPLLKSLYGEWGGRNVQVVGIAVDYRDKVVAYAAEMKIPYPLLLGEQDALDIAAKLGVASPVFPFTVFTDRRGEVVTLFVGELHKPQADLILSAVQSVDEHRVGLPEARRSIAAALHALAANPSG